jgi:ATP dependent DNA ligase domain
MPVVTKAEQPYYHQGDLGPGVAKRHTSPLPEVKKPQVWEFSAHPHLADRAGPHIDLRLGNPGTGIAHSFVLPKRTTLPGPGEMCRVIPTFDHSIPYMNFTGPISTKYGKGTVVKGRRTQAEVYHADPQDSPGTKLRFNLYEAAAPEEFAIRKDQTGRWFLHNKTKTRESRPDIPAFKPDYKEIDLASVDPTNPRQAIMPKLDGAHVVVDLEAGRAPRLYSYREAKVSPTGLIEHTHKVQQFLDYKVPKELDRTILRAEVIAIQKDGRLLPTQELGGILNSRVWQSRSKQRELGVKLKVFPFSVVSVRGTSMEDAPFDQKLKVLQDVAKKLPALAHPPIATTTEEKIHLLELIKSGGHPLTEEGVVIVEPGGVRYTKAKLLHDHDVYVRQIHPAVSGKTGEEHDRAGAVSYSWTSDGPIMGQFGGFKHEEARHMLKHPDQYVGRVAKVKAMKLFKDKEGNPAALFQPRFNGWHLDKNDIEKQAFLRGFFDELQKIAYSVEGHEYLINKSIAAGLPETSREAKKALVKGTVGTDVGISFPLLPWSDVEHSFPNIPKRQIDQNIKKKFETGVTDIAEGIVEGKNVLVNKGLKDIGSAHHSLMDYESHSKKPGEMGAAAPELRRTFKNFGPVGRAGGGWLSLVEHLRTGYKVDKINPKEWTADQRAIQKSVEFGKSIKPAIVEQMMELGLKKNEAVERLNQALKKHRVSWTEDLESNTRRNVAYVGKQLNKLNPFGS